MTKGVYTSSHYVPFELYCSFIVRHNTYVADDQRCLHLHTKYASSYMHVLKHEWKYVITKQVICIFVYTCVPMHSHNYVPYCPAVTPPPFATYFQEKEGGGRNNEDLRFRLAVKPPLPLPRIRVLCSAVEDENSFDRHAVAVLKDGRVVGHVHVAKHSR